MDVFKRKISLLLLLLALCLCLTACARNDPAQAAPEPASAPEPMEAPEPEPEPQPEPEPEPEAVPAAAEVVLEPEPEEPVYEVQEDTGPVYEPLAESNLEEKISKVPVIENPNPLTGLAMEDPEQVQARPIAVMLNNIQAALPQYGNSQADMIFEIVAEGGITRMIGLYQSVEGIEQIGSVRSTRPYYIDVAQGYDAILVHCGGSNDAYSTMDSRGTDHIDGIYTDAIFWRDQERIRTVGSEHSMFTSGPLIQDYLAQSDFRLAHREDYAWAQSFADAPAMEDGQAAGHVDVPISGYKSTVFDYDTETGRYLVSQFGKAYSDGQDGSQVAVDNVLILYTAISGTGDSLGHMEAITTGSGPGLYCQGGLCEDVTWTRSSLDEPFAFTLEDGSQLALARGTTYVCIVSNSCDVAVS